MQTELWNEIQPMSQYEIIGVMLRNQFQKEQVKRIDLSYLGSTIDTWWTQYSGRTTDFTASAELQTLVLKILSPEHLILIKSVGNDDSKISAVLSEYVFSLPDKNLARLVHEVFAKIGGIVDIKYPYEEHKELYPMNNDQVASDWGKGYGMIRPHSDDLYEDRDINAMSLTVFKDTSCTPTWFWPLNDVVSCLSNEELGYFALGEGTFFSGTNVEGKTIQNKKPLLRRDSVEGFGLRMDFRIDDAIGPRLRFSDSKLQEIFEKMRVGFRALKPISTNPSTGSVSILSNFKVLHGRSALNPVMLYEGETSRVLFRSKGIKLGAI